VQTEDGRPPAEKQRSLHRWETPGRRMEKNRISNIEQGISNDEGWVETEDGRLTRKNFSIDY